MNRNAARTRQDGPQRVFLTREGLGLCGSPKMRHRRIKAFGHFYRLHAPAGDQVSACFYCGAESDSHDHCPPLCWMDEVSPQELEQRGIPMVIFRCCTGCNSDLGSRKLFTAAERLQFLLEKRSRIHEQVAPVWGRDEDEGMTPRYRELVRARKAALSELERRIRHLKQRLADTHTHPEHCHAA